MEDMTQTEWDNLKLTINKKEEENNNLLYQYTKNTKVNPLNSI